MTMNDERNIPASLIVLFLIMTAGIISAGYLNYNQFSKYHREKMESELLAIADLKVNDLVRWKAERIGDGAVFYGNAAFNNLARKFFINPSDAQPAALIKSWLAKTQSSYQYNQIHLVDSPGRLRLSVPPGSGIECGDWIEYLKEARQSGTAVLTDFHRKDTDKPVHLSVITPLVNNRDTAEVYGYIVMIIDPGIYLFPQLKKWPTASKTAETLLVRRDGDGVQFINELRFQKNTPLNLRFSLKEEYLPAVMAILGREGIVEGIDYRGVSVIAALRHVPGTPWFMIARMDQDEIYAPIRERFRIMLIIIIGFIAGTAAGIGFYWRKKSRDFYREKSMAAESLRQSEAFTRAVLDNLPVGISVNSVYPSVDFSYMNDNFPKFYRTTREKLLNPDSFWDEVYEDPEFRDYIKKQVIEDCNSADPEKMKWYNIPLTRKGQDTTYISARNIPLPDRGMMISMVWDVTELKKAEDALKESEEKFRSIVEGAPDPIFIQTEGNFSYVNPAALQLFGMDDAGRLLGRPVIEQVEFEFQNIARERIRVLNEERRPVKQPLEIRFIKIDGSRVGLKQRVTCMYNGKHGDMVVLRDISGRNHAEVEVFCALRIWRVILESSSLPRVD
jgi:PAS domain S-box-containing protein